MQKHTSIMPWRNILSHLSQYRDLPIMLTSTVDNCEVSMVPLLQVTYMKEE